jgi:ABC-type glycerol-3-phosphate transport system substrate-binding protein
MMHHKQKFVVFLLVTMLMMSCCAIAVNAAHTTITFWYWSWGAAMDQAVQTVISLFEQDNPDIKVEAAPWNSIDKLMVNVVAGTAPDVIITGGGHLPSLVPKGGLLPLDDFLANSPDIADAIVDPNWRIPSQMDGSIWYIPAVEWGPRDGLVYNKTFFAEAGLPPINPNVPPTWDVIAGYHKKLVRTNADGKIAQFGYLPYEGRNLDISFLEMTLDANPWNKEKQIIQVNTPAITAAYTFLYENFIAPWGYDAIQAGLGAAGWYMVANGKTAMANLGYYAPKNVDGKPWEFGYAWPPTLSGKRVTNLSGWGLALPPGKHPNEAWRFISFLIQSLEAQRIFFEHTGFFTASKKFFSSFRTDNEGYNWFINAVLTNEYVLPEDGRPSYMYGLVGSTLGPVVSNVFTGQMSLVNFLEAAQLKIEVEVENLSR